LVLMQMNFNWSRQITELVWFSAGSPSITDFHSFTPNLPENKFSLKLLSCYNLSYIFHSRKIVQISTVAVTACALLWSPLTQWTFPFVQHNVLWHQGHTTSNSGFIRIIIIILTIKVYHLLLHHQNYYLNTPHYLNLQSLLWNLQMSLYPSLSSTSALTMTLQVKHRQCQLGCHWGIPKNYGLASNY
jgi:hypothetical protein